MKQILITIFCASLVGCALFGDSKSRADIEAFSLQQGACLIADAELGMSVTESALDCAIKGGPAELKIVEDFIRDYLTTKKMKAAKRASAPSASHS